MIKTTLTEQAIELVTSNWRCEDCDDCGEIVTAHDVSFTWVAENGTPSCECGADMVVTSVDIQYS